MLCPSVSCAPPYSKVPTCEDHALWRCWGCAGSLPDISWVSQTLLCFSDTTSSEMPPDGPGRLWFYLLTAAVSICQPYNQGWVHILAAFPSLCVCFSAAVGAVLCPPIAGHGDTRDAPQEPGWGLKQPFPQLCPLLSAASILFMGSMNYSCPGRRGCVCDRLCDAKGADMLPSTESFSV